MSRTACVALVAALAGPPSLAAQNDPFLGIWEFSPARSSVTRGTPPRAETVVNAVEPGGFSSTMTIASERSTGVEVHHFIFDGTFHRTEGSDPRELAARRIDPHTIEQDTRRNGEITVHRRFTLSPDGKTMTVIANGKSGGGQPYTNDTRVYERKTVADAPAAGLGLAGAAQAPRVAQPTPPCGQNMPAAVRNVDPQSRCFELRTYTVREGSAIDQLHSRFRDRTTALFRKHGMTIVGYWQPIAKPDTLVYLLAYKDSTARDASWAAFGADPEWVKTRTEMPVSVQVESTFMGATDYSPMK